MSWRLVVPGWLVGMLAGCATAPAEVVATAPAVVEVADAAEAGEVLAPEKVLYVPPPPPRPKDPYQALRYDIDQERHTLARRRALGEDVAADAASVIDQRLPQLINAWKGTRWSYSGTTQTPKQGKIACGYFVSTVLEHAGFEVDRVDLARQASEQILRSLIPDGDIARYSYASRDYVVAQVEKQGDGVYLVGLDTHIGFLVNEPNKPVNFCHSTKRDRRAGVVCELARTSPSFKSRYTVVGKLAQPETVGVWLAGADLPTARKGEPQCDALVAEAEVDPTDGAASAER
ncbi:MAG: hypothetical protein ABMA64_11910 [Myxococcota bacterium]